MAILRTWAFDHHVDHTPLMFFRTGHGPVSPPHVVKQPPYQDPYGVTHFIRPTGKVDFGFERMENDFYFRHIGPWSIYFGTPDAPELSNSERNLLNYAFGASRSGRPVAQFPVKELIDDQLVSGSGVSVNPTTGAISINPVLFKKGSANVYCVAKDNEVDVYVDQLKVASTALKYKIQLVGIESSFGYKPNRRMN